MALRHILLTSFNIVNNAIEQSNSLLSDSEIIEKYIGGGWVVEETFAIAVFCILLHFDNIKRTFVCAVNHEGDNDSTRAVASNIIGAIHVYNTFPDKFIHDLQFTI